MSMHNSAHLLAHTVLAVASSIFRICTPQSFRHAMPLTEVTLKQTMRSWTYAGQRDWRLETGGHVRLPFVRLAGGLRFVPREMRQAQLLIECTWRVGGQFLRVPPGRHDLTHSMARYSSATVSTDFVQVSTSRTGTLISWSGSIHVCSSRTIYAVLGTPKCVVMIRYTWANYSNSIFMVFSVWL